jgi:uncharacterized membrane protein
LRLESRIGRLLGAGTLMAVGLLAIGTVAFLAGGGSPLDPAPRFDPSQLVGDIASLRAAAFVWLGLVIVLATPGARVVAALLGYLRAGEQRMALVAVLILAVIAAGVVAGTAGA